MTHEEQVRIAVDILEEEIDAIKRSMIEQGESEADAGLLKSFEEVRQFLMDCNEDTFADRN